MCRSITNNEELDVDETSYILTVVRCCSICHGRKKYGGIPIEIVLKRVVCLRILFKSIYGHMPYFSLICDSTMPKCQPSYILEIVRDSGDH